MYKIYVEGGGDGESLRSECREGFTTLLRKAGLEGKMPRIVACGSRLTAFDRFKTGVVNGETCFLLVDSEYLTGDETSPWVHLRNREGDRWVKPEGITEERCHLMVVCMETWLLSDPEALQVFFGQGFQGGKLPTSHKLEQIEKKAVFKALADATKRCKIKGPYAKGSHSFKLLAAIDPSKLRKSCRWANRLFGALEIRQ